MSAAFELSVPVLVEEGTRFEGLLCFRGHSRIRGEFRGEISASGRLEIGESAEVVGRVEADEVVIAGRFEGEIVARASLEVLSTAIVTGDLVTRQFSAEEGCEVRGSCRTIESAPASEQDAPEAPSSS